MYRTNGSTGGCIPVMMQFWSTCLLAPFVIKTFLSLLENGQLMRFWYLSHRRKVEAQASLRISAVSPEPSRFAHMKYGRRKRVRRERQWIAAHACLKIKFTEGGKCYNLMSRLI